VPTTSRRTALEHTYFEPVPIDAYTECGIPAELVERFRPLLERDTRLYRYQPDTTLTPGCRFLKLSDWTLRWREHPLITSTVSIGLQTYTRECIASIQDAYAQYLSKQGESPLLPADMMEGDSSLLVSSRALRALAHLLHKRLEEIARG
jgi:hypothetical protein